MAATLALANEQFTVAIEQAKATARLNPTEAIAMVDRLIEDDTRDLSLVERTQLFSFRAELYRNLGQLDQALSDAERGRGLAQQTGEPEIRAELLRVLGTIEAESGDVSAALERFHEAWMLLEGSEASLIRLRLAIALGVGHQMIENHARSVDYLNLGLGLSRALGNRTQEATILGNLAISQHQLEAPEASLALHQQALELFTELGHEFGIASQLANLCDRNVSLGRTEDAETICTEAVERLEPLGATKLLAGVHGVLGTLYRLQGDLDAALTAYLRALEQADGQIPTVERDVLDRLARLHIQRGEPEEALSAYRRYMDTREALWNERNRQTLQELEVQYDLRERESELRLARAEAALKSIALTHRNRLLILVTCLAIALVVLIAFVLRENGVRARLQDALADRNKKLEAAVETIGYLAMRDPLTELHNRRAFTTVAEQEIARARRNQLPMCVLMIDIDHFKHLNDHHGHAIGDLVLKDIANVIRTTLREQDVLCRWGGEEFVVLLPDTDLDRAWTGAERVRKTINQTTIKTTEAVLHVTVTIGLARVDGDLDEAINAADQAMYQGKRAGRNRVSVEDLA